MSERSIDPTNLDILTEQQVLAAMVINTALVEIAANRLVPDDFSHAIHAMAFAEMMAIREDGRGISMQSLCRIFGDSAELEPGLTGEAYARQIMEDCTNAEPEGFKRSVDIMLDRRMRRRIAAVGTRLSSLQFGLGSVRDAALDAVEELDAIKAAFRGGIRTKYSASDCAQSAIDHWLSDGNDEPVTGVEGLDRMIGGWARGQLTIIAARPAMGKSAVMLSAARRAAHKGARSLIFSLEMTERQIGARMLADECFTAGDEAIEYEAIALRTLENSERTQRRIGEAKKRLSGLPFTVEEQRGVSASEIVSRIGRHVADLERDGKKLDAVYVDHIGLIRASKRYAGVRYREVAEITDALATAAKDFNIAVIGMCQLNRGVEGRENKRPSLADLRDSGSIEEDASAVLFLYRPAYYLELQGVQENQDTEMKRLNALEATRNTLEIIIAKNRNGRTGNVTQFVNIGANAVRPMSFGGR